ncbi:MAG TPA: hypothetical protein VJ859_15140 [Allosphingosinicella sp.]|nr:hypothetical protein [Allosphingosinicella sp.]
MAIVKAAAAQRLLCRGCATFELISDIELSNANSLPHGHDCRRAGYRLVGGRYAIGWMLLMRRRL